MESLYVLIPLSAGLVLVILAIFGWALHKGQFDDLEDEGERILTEDAEPIDTDQGLGPGGRKESRNRHDLTE